LSPAASAIRRPIHVSEEPEASLRGAACFALERLGHHPPIPKLGPAIRPNRRAAQAYRAARERQARLEKELRTLYPETDP
jgi:gluconokinase